MNIAICFCVRNCGKYLPSIFENIERLKILKFNIFCIFVYDNCSDNSEKLLLEYQTNSNNVIVKNITNNSKHRTVRISTARNVCLDIIYNELDNISFHMMIDSDDRCSNNWNIDIINKYLNNFDDDDWDSISFNKKDYYDIWALLYDNFKHHCFGYDRGMNVVRAMQRDISKKLNECKSNSIEVLSGFNGFAIYKTEKFKDFYYDGLYENFKNLVSDDEVNNSIQALKDKFNLDVKLRQNPCCCEHLFYHISAFKKGRKIKISKLIVI